MQETRKGYVVTDICDTLFYSNTTFDFIRFCAEKGWLSPARRRRWKALLQRSSPFFWMLAIYNKVAKIDSHKQAAVSLLAGYDEATVRSWAREFYEQYLNQRKIEPAYDVIRRYADQHSLVLASSSIEPVVAEIAAAIHASHYVATMLEKKGGTYTGKVLEDLTGRKVEALLHLLELKEGEITAVLSDNHTDRSLMELAKDRYALCYTDAHEAFWKQVPGISILKVGNNHPGQ